MKKFFIITSIILIIFLIALVGYYFIIKTNSQVSENIPLSIRNFFPFGGSAVTVDTPREVIPEENQNPVNFTKKLRKISSDAVAGAGVFDSLRGTTIRYIEKATGHIYDTELFSSRSERISNKTLPRVYSAVWGTSSTTLVATYLKDDNETVETYSLSLKQSTSTTDSGGVGYNITGSFLQFNIKTISPYKNTMLYSYVNDGRSVGVISNYTGGNKKEVWSSPIKEVLPQFITDTTVSITTKPSENVSGFMYFINTRTGENTKILGNIPGLSTLTSPDAKNVLVLEQGPNGDALYTYSIGGKTFTNMSPVTFPEKCVWSKKDTTILYCAVPRETLVNTSLTTWYKGLTSFTDDIWKFDTKNNVSNIVLNITTESGENVDVIQPQLSENERYLVFINKRDGSLWSFDTQQ